MLEHRRAEVEAAEAAYESAAGQSAENAKALVSILVPLERVMWMTVENEEVPAEAPWIFTKRAIAALVVTKGREKLSERVAITWAGFPKVPTPGKPRTPAR